MAYIHSCLFDRVKRAIKTIETADQQDLLTLVKRHVRDDIDVTQVTDQAVIVDGGTVHIELEYEYFNVLDRCLVNTVQIRID